MRGKTFLSVVVFLFSVAGTCVAATPSFRSLGDLPGGSFWSVGIAVSPEGTAVAGRSWSANTNMMLGLISTKVFSFLRSENEC